LVNVLPQVVPFPVGHKHTFFSPSGIFPPADEKYICLKQAKIIRKLN